MLLTARKAVSVAVDVDEARASDDTVQLRSLLRSPRAVQRGSDAPQTRGPAYEERNRGPGSAPHRFALRRARDTKASALLRAVARGDLLLGGVLGGGVLDHRIEDG